MAKTAAVIRVRSVVIDRETRDVLVPRVRSYETGQFEHFDETLRCASREEVLAGLERVRAICEFLDETGWEEHGSRDRYDITVTQQVVSWVTTMQADIADELRSDLRTLDRCRAGDENWYLIDRGQEDSIVSAERVVERDRHAIELLDRLAEAVA